MSHLELVTLVVRDYDAAIRFFVDVLRFDDGDQQTSIVGQQFAARVGMFLRVEDFDTAYQRMVAAGVRFVSPPRDEPYGRFAVFLDLEGNRWDLLGRDPRR
jgi:uncharacterized glyoxalase superfamily protein PhnB